MSIEQSVYEGMARRIESLEAENEALRKDAAWIPVSERLPEIPTNCTREFIVACQRKHDGKTYVFAAEYLQQLLLQSTLPDDDEPEDGKPYTGWYQERKNSVTGKHWNPLTDDSDALRLAVKLNLHKSIAEAHRLIDDGTDIYAATRRAITRAAAEIGRVSQ